MELTVTELAQKKPAPAGPTPERRVPRRKLGAGDCSFTGGNGVAIANRHTKSNFSCGTKLGKSQSTSCCDQAAAGASANATGRIGFAGSLSPAPAPESAGPGKTPETTHCRANRRPELQLPLRNTPFDRI